MKKKILVLLLTLVTTVMLLCSSGLTAMADSGESEAKVTVSSAKILETEENGETKYQLVVNITNLLEEDNNGKTVGLYAKELQISVVKYDDMLFTFADNSECKLEHIAAYATETVYFNIEPVSADVTGAETAIDYEITYTPENIKAESSDATDEAKVTVSGKATVNQKTTELGTILNFVKQMGFYSIFADFETYWPNLVMICISFGLMFLAIVRKFEPLLLLPIAFGMLLTNLPGAGMYHEFLFAGGHVNWNAFSANAGLVDYLYLGVKLGIYPCLIFIGVGAMTDFGPLISNPKSLLLGAAAQLGIFATFFVARESGFFSAAQAGSIGIIGGADGPTAIFVATKLSPELLGPIAVAAYSYMALVPVIQPPIMRLLTTKKEREIVMKPARIVSKREKIIFPIAVTAFVALLVPSAAALVGCLMLGNLMRECGVVERLAKTVQNELMNIVTICLGISVGATATAATFLTVKTVLIVIMGVVAFGMGTAGGVLLAKFMNLFLKNKINPLIGSAGVSAVPMAARVSQVEGQRAKPGNYLLMHAMGPNVAGVIGSAIAAGVLLALFGA